MATMTEEGKNNKESLLDPHQLHSRKWNPPPFLLKTYMLVEDPATDNIISWNPDGTAFVVWQPAEFARDLLPTLFKHSNFSSFVRQLNTYGFRKAATNRWEFCNDKFRKGEKEKLSEIRRRKAWSNRQQQQANHNQEYSDQEEQRSYSTSSSSGYSNLVDENKRLKRENGALNSELAAMKRKCRDLLELVANHHAKTNEEEEDEGAPLLFGVRLHVKRGQRDLKTNPSPSIFLPQSCK
ncbi:hypothetical protein K1719_007974 [Acacia pycnantha]|nr:hypothetical protein K1719_007974 [Acacia pycnantha]